ncbi:MAG: inorganic phosphate transporter [Chloroflexi bacterium]|nr:inorganic phosphate transporter [Chloroflexota bacterium]
MLLWFSIALALIFDLLNGYNDSGALTATSISSHALPPRLALRLTAIGAFLGPFLFGVSVAHTIGQGLLTSEGLNLLTIPAALLAAILWSLISARLGIPSSSSHALVGGLVGAALMATGDPSVIQLKGLLKVLLALFLSPLLGFVSGFLFTRGVYFLARNATPRINNLFRLLQAITLFGMSLSHGANDAQKSMGLISLALLLSGAISRFYVPTWVILSCALAIALGSAFGSQRHIRTLGGRVYRVRPIHGVASQLSSALVIALAAWLGGPVSTTHVISSSIIGSGAAERFGKVRWQIAQDMLLTWLLTIPLTGFFAAAIFWLLQRL